MYENKIIEYTADLPWLLCLHIVVFLILRKGYCVVHHGIGHLLYGIYSCPCEWSCAQQPPSACVSQ